MADFSRGKGMIIPCLGYNDAAAAIEWLCTYFGFEKHLVVPGKEAGEIVHAELTFGNSMIMLGSSSSDTEFSRMIKHPSAIGGFETQSPYLVVEDAEAHYNKAKEGGAEIVIELKREDYGGSGYTCRDPEGHLWSVGSYNPYQQTS